MRLGVSRCAAYSRCIPQPHRTFCVRQFELMSKEPDSTETRPEAELVALFQRNGYMRVPNPDRREEDPDNYKKGYEIRWVVATRRETAAIRRLLRRVGIKGGKPFLKNRKWVQPVYGKKALERFKEWLEEFGE